MKVGGMKQRAHSALANNGNTSPISKNTKGSKKVGSNTDSVPARTYRNSLKLLKGNLLNQVLKIIVY